MADHIEQDYGRPESNGLGLAGFIVSLIGFVGTCGLLSPIGLIMSLVALGRRPKGFAIAGVVIGALGSLWIFAFAIVAVVGGAVAVITLMAMLGLGAVAAVMAMTLGNVGSNALTVFKDIHEHYEQDGRVPYALTELTNLRPEQLDDKWGNPMIYEPDADGQGFTLRSLGEDGVEGTKDDWRVYVNFQTEKFEFKSENADWDFGGDERSSSP